MAAGPSNNLWMWPFSGDVTQDYHPATSWFRTMMGQFGFINVNEMQSDDPDLEKRIVEGVGSYGKQLGRIIDALKVVCARMDREKLTRDEREAVRSFDRLAEEIDALKAASQPVTQGSIDQIVAALRTLKEHDRTTFEQIQERLRSDDKT